MSRLFQILVLLSFITLPVVAQRSPKTLLWRISGNGLTRPSYIYGTIHVQERRAFEFSDSVLLKLQECSAFAGELRIDSMMNQTLRRFMASADSAVDIESRYSNISYATEESGEDEEDTEDQGHKGLGFTLDRLQDSPPWMVRGVMSRDQAGTEIPYKSTFLDAYLFRLAKLEKKQLIGIESIDEQLNVFDSIAADRYPPSGWDAENSESETEVLEQMITLYRRADLDGILKLTRNNSSSRFYDLLLTKRNYRMSERIDTLIHGRSTFIAIGVAHLPGSGGVLQLLRNRGFSVTPVKATFTGLAKWYREPRDTIAWYDYSSPEMAIAASLPIEPVELSIGSMPIPLGPRLAALSPRFVITIDISTGLSYMLLTLDLPQDIASDRERAFDEIIGRMSQSDSSTIKSRREVMHDSVSGVEFFSNDKQGGNDRVGVFLRGNRIYGAIVSSGQSLLWSSDADRFFKSLRFTPLTAREWEKVSPEKGSCSMLMPGDVRRQKISSGSGMYSQSRGELFMAHEHSNGFYCIASYLNDVRAGTSPHGDSICMEETLRRTWESVGGTLDRKINFKFFGYPALDYTLDLADSSRLHGQAIIRGHRIYSVVAGGPAGDEVQNSMNRFFNSFELLPTRKPAWNRVAIDSLGFAVDLPSAPTTVRGYSGLYGPSSRTSVLSSDEYSGQSYNVYLDRYSEYYQAANEGSFFDQILEDRKGDDDSILSSRTISIGGNPGRDVEFAFGNSGGRYRVRYVLNGNRFYQLVSPLPSEETSGDDLGRFFDSFTLLDSVGTGDIFSNKTTKLLADLSAADTARRNRASRALQFFDPDSTDLVRLRQALRRHYADEAGESGGVRGAILSRLGTIGDSESIGPIGQIYSSLAHGARRSAIRALVELDTKESLDTLTNLLLRDRDVIAPDQEYTLAPLSWEPHNVGVMYPRILTLIGNPSYRATLMHLTAAALDSAIITPEMILPYRDAIIEALGSAIDQKIDTESEAESDSAIRSFTMAYGAQCLGHLPPSPLADSLLDLLLAGSDKEVVLEAGVALLGHGVTIDMGKFQPVAADPAYRVELYQALERIGRLDCFPSSYKLQQYMAESALYDRLVNSEEMDDPEIKFVAEREVEYKGVRGRVFLFKFRERSNKDDSWYSALAGMQPLDHTRLSSSSDFAVTNYSTLESKSTDEHVSQLLKSAESSARDEEEE